MPMTKRCVSSILIATSLVLLPVAETWAGCTKDTDCKGARVCEEGRCVAPSPAPTSEPTPAATPAPVVTPAAPAAPAAPDLETMRRAIHAAEVVAARAARPRKVVGGYFEASYLYKHSAFGELEGLPSHSGVHLSGHRALTNKIHLGGYFGYTSVGEAKLLAAGISLKAGSWIRDRVWIGLALNHGVEIITGEHAIGLMQLSPRLHLDVLLHRSDSVSVAASLSAGPEILVGKYGTGGNQILTAGLVIGR
jgi:hypothetical protein